MTSALTVMPSLNFLTSANSQRRGSRIHPRVLSGTEKLDFNFLVRTLQPARSNLSRHIEKLDFADHIKVKKSSQGKLPDTSYKITQKGSKALTQHWENLDAIRQISQSPK